MKTVIFVVAGACAAALLSPARAQTISQPSGCIAGVPCQAATLAIGGASLGGNTLAVTGVTSLGGAVTLNGFNLAGVGALSVGGATLGSNVFAATGDAQVSGQFVAFSNITTGAATRFQFSGRSALSSPADGQLTVSNNGSTNSFTVTTGASNLASFNGTVTAATNLFGAGLVGTNTDNGKLVMGASTDVLLTRKASATIQHGDADAASPVAQTITAQSVSAGTPNTAAPNLTIDAPKGTGAGPGGSFIVRVAPAGTAGSAQNAMTTALTIDSTFTATQAGSGHWVWSGRSDLSSPADGTVRMLNNAGTGFTSLCFGPCTSSFARLAVSGTGLALQLADGSASTALSVGTLTGTSLRSTPTTVSGLTTCAAGMDGLRQFVTDATATTFAAAVTGGGSNHVPVYCDGSGTPTWKIG